MFIRLTNFTGFPQNDICSISQISFDFQVSKRNVVPDIPAICMYRCPSDNKVLAVATELDV